VALEPVGITQEHVNQFFKGQPLLSDFAPLNGDVNVDEVLLNSTDDGNIGLESPLDPLLRVQPKGAGVTRRLSFYELDYLYRAARQSSKAGRQKKTAEHTFWGSAAAEPASATAASPTHGRRKHKTKGGNATEVSTRPPRVRTELTAQEKELRDEALYASLIRMYELQARLEAESAHKSSLLGRVGGLFTFGSSSEDQGKDRAQAIAGALGRKSSKGNGGDKATVAAGGVGANTVRSFASMFSLPRLFRRKE